MTYYKEIGGYFELNINPGTAYYQSLKAFNTGRNSFEYILLANKYTKVYIPLFTCDVLLEPINRNNIDFEFYRINEKLELIELPGLKESEAFLYTNYFGLKNDYIIFLARQVKNLIIDNAQGFFSEPLTGIDTFYSPRKFFGVPDGGYVSCSGLINEGILPKEISVDKCSHLLLRLEAGSGAGYEAFKKNEEKLKEQPVKWMSALTKSLLAGIDYAFVKKQRNLNFKFLHENLYQLNKIDWIPDTSINSPLVYPFRTPHLPLRKLLIESKIFVATYWPNVFEWANKNDLEFNLANEIIPLPIDQRYNLEDMNRIVNIIFKYNGI